MIIDIGSSIEVPANSSRFFKDSSEAISEPTGMIQLAIQDGLLFNRRFNQDLIVYDEHYCTTVSALNESYTLPIIAYLDSVLELFAPPPHHRYWVWAR